MNEFMKKGFGFGITSGVITTLGLIVGLAEGYHSKNIVVGGILTIAMADALSDSLGIHISTESEKRSSDKDVWTATISTFVTKFIISSSFLVPILFLPLNIAIVTSILWGLFLISLFTYKISKHQNKSSFNPVVEHIVITVFVILATYYIGNGLRIFTT